MTFGFCDPVTITTGTQNHIDIHLGALPGDRCMLWRKRVHVVRAQDCRPWTCAVCDGSRVWWSLTDTPTCAMCVPMPAEVYDRAWQEAQAFIELLAEGKDPAQAPPIRAELDRAIESGDLNELLKLCIAQHLMELQIKLGREAMDEQERGERS